MAHLRLFAGLRDAAGTGSVDIEGSTVGEVLEAAAERFGPTFSASMQRARVWVNGDEAVEATSVKESDEVALIPPVSGGSGPMIDLPSGSEWILAVAAGLILIWTNNLSSDVWWWVAVVGVVVAWASDVAGTASASGRDIPLIPTLLSVISAVTATRLLGIDGLGIALALAVVFPLAWSVASDESRVLFTLAPSLVISLVSTAAVSSLVLTRISFEPISRATGVFLAMAIAATAIGGVIERFSHLPFGDPFTATTITAILTSLAIASVWDLDLVTFLIMGVVGAAALIAGGGLGSLLRTQYVVLIQRPPGYFSGLDGVVLAAAVYLPILRLVA